MASILRDDGEEMTIVFMDRDLVVPCHHVHGGKHHRLPIQVAHHLGRALSGEHWADQAGVQPPKITDDPALIHLPWLHYGEELMAPLCGFIAGAQDSCLDSCPDFSIECLPHMVRYIEGARVRHRLNV